MKNQVGNQKIFSEKNYYLRNLGLFVHQGFYALDHGGKILYENIKRINSNSLLFVSFSTNPRSYISYFDAFW